MAQTIPITKSSYLLQMEGLDFYWQEFSGLNDTAQVTEYSDGLSNRNYNLVGPRKLAEMTLRKSFDPKVDGVIISWFRNYCEGADKEKTVSVTPVKYCPNPEPIGKTLILYGVKPVSLKGFEVDKRSQDLQILELSILADDYTYA